MTSKLVVSLIVSSVQLLSSRVWFFAIPWTAARQTSLSITNSPNLLKLMSIESVMPSNHLIPVVPFSSCLQSFPASGSISNQSVLCIRWPKYWSFSFSISTSNEYSALISFRIDWYDLLAVQGTFKSLLQHHSSKASILQCSAFLIVPLSYPYMTTGKTIALTRQTFVRKVMSLLFSMLSRLVTAFSSKEKASFNFMAAVTICSDFGAQENKVCYCFPCFPIYLPEVMGSDAMILVFWMLTFKSTFTFTKKLFSSSSFSAIRVVSSTYVRLLIFLLAVLIPGCASSSLAFHMMHSA